MDTMFDYLKWRGDLSFYESAPCEVDALILSMCSYVSFKILQGKGISFASAAENYCHDRKYDKVNLGLIMPSKNINKLFCSAAETERFGKTVIADLKIKTSVEECCQFAAVTVLTPGKRAFVIFRGTDDTIVGWREDFRLSYSERIPAQAMALEYLERAAEKYPDRKLYIAGHSKGGNLAMYSATHASESVRRRIARAYSFDGPGLNEKTMLRERFGEMSRRMDIYVPQSSFIGIMFDRGKNYKVLKSDGIGPYQHDPFTWALEGPALSLQSSLSPRGQKNEEQFRQAMDSMTDEEKREFEETFFAIVDATGAKTLTQLSDKGARKLLTIIKGYNGLDKQKKDMMLTLVLRLLGAK